MQVDYLIVGQGICGTMLSWFLHREGKTFLIIDDNSEKASSKVAAGVINPVTGRRYAYTWMIDEIMPFAVQAYEEMGKYFDTQFVFQKSVIDFFPSPQMRNAFIDRLTEDDTFLHSYPDQNHFNPYFNYDFGCGEINPAYTVHLQLVISSWRKKLQELDVIKEEKFDVNDLKAEKDFISYQNITAQKVIFCDGTDGVNNPWFQMLPYAPNKGEAIIIECEDLTTEHIFKKSLALVPLPKENVYWIGSNYQWEFENNQPSNQFYQHATLVLNGWLKKPYKVLAHKAAVRPATLERRPFVGFHPQFQNIGILNGMGTKGTSLAPFFAHQLAQHLVYNFPISPEADVHRFTRILSK
ncbi:MAG TPA: FAD-binding oxidoreductase [Flavisolibacter sp.]|jgi:glycine/D-amino acid oxidase-like deaminating enzyme|nr:FAD-binding oxidoreductase [Flavisolibacter sp.]